MRLLVTVNAAVLVLCAATASSAAPAPPTCTAAQLRVSHGPFDGTAGHFHWAIRFRNVSAAACTLRGFPAVRSVDGGHRVGAPAAHDTGAPVRRIRLAAHGGVASAGFTQTDAGVYSRATCHPATATGLRVRPPGVGKVFAVHLRHTVCATTPPGGDSTIRAVVRGTGGP